MPLVVRAPIEQGDHPVEIDGVAWPTVSLVRCKISLTVGDNLPLMLVNDPLDDFVVWVSLRSKPTKETLLDGEHFDVVDSMPVPRPRRRTRGKRKVLVLRDVRGNVGAEGHGKVPPLSPELQSDDQQTGTTVLLHKLSVASSKPLQEVIGNRDDPHAACPPLEEARPVSQRTPLHVGDILRLRTPSPPEVIRTRGPYSWSRGPRHPYCTRHAGSPEDVLKHSPISRWNDSLPQEARSTEERRHNSPSRRNRSAKCESGSFCI